MFIIDILKATAILFLEMAPYLMLGLLFVALLNFFFTKEMIFRHVGKENFWSVLKSALFGVPLPLCSCGVIPTAVYMSKNGASKGAIVSFLISTPQTGIDSMIATYGMMGPFFAVFRPLAAFFMGIIGGMVARLSGSEIPYKKQQPRFDEYQQISDKKEESIIEKIKKSLRYASVEFVDDISIQFVTGLFIAGLITYFIPDNFFSDSFVSNGIIGMLLIAAIGVPMYVCATASIPVAVSLMMKGFSPGVAFVFLASGPATNAASISILTKVLGKKLTIIFISTITILSIIFGLILDQIFIISGVNHLTDIKHVHIHESGSATEFQLVIGIIFFILILLSLYRKYFKNRFIKKEAQLVSDSTVLKIEGMTCNHCSMNIRKAIISTEGVTGAEVSLSDKTAVIQGNFNLSELTKAVENMGYKVV